MLWLGLLILHWIEVVRWKPFFCPGLRGKALDLHHWVWCWMCTCHIWPFSCLHSFFLYLIGWELLLWKDVNFVKWFCCICWGDDMISIHFPVNVVYWDVYDEPSLHPRGASHVIDHGALFESAYHTLLSMVKLLLKHWWGQVCIIQQSWANLEQIIVQNTLISCFHLNTIGERSQECIHSWIILENNLWLKVKMNGMYNNSGNWLELIWNEL